MIAKIYSAIPHGFSGRLVEVEGDTNLGLPAFNIVGMGGKTITEARERVRSAIANSNLSFPNKKVTINLAPADISKDGTYLDLPIALSVLMIAGQLKANDVANRMFVGELSLDGTTRPVRGIINITEIAKQNHFQEIYVPQANLAQASLIPDITVYGISSLLELFLHLKEEKPLSNTNLKLNRDENVKFTTSSALQNSNVVKNTTPDHYNIVKATTNFTPTINTSVVKSTTVNNLKKNVVNSTITDKDVEYLRKNVVKNTTKSINSASAPNDEVPKSPEEIDKPNNPAVNSTIEQSDNINLPQNTAQSTNSALLVKPLQSVKNTKTDSKLVFLDDIKDQPVAKRALSIAIAGHHNILFCGPPGTGKTMLAKAALNLLPEPSEAERITITKIHSLFGEADDVIYTRPFRAPHHTASAASIIGGGSHILPGEISMAHHGILFLDELPEYPKNVLEALRQPLEDKVITITRAEMRTTYPADFMLIATMNPCPCGYLNDPHHACHCSENQIANYQKRVSGPILDRFDIIINVERADHPNLFQNSTSDNSEHLIVKNNITEAIQRQYQRYNRTTYYNSSLSSRELTKYLKITKSAQNFLNSAIHNLNLSTRAYLKILKVAQTIADLDQKSQIDTEQISESLTFRQRLSPR